MRNTKVIDLVPKTRERISFDKFASLMRDRRDTIKAVNIQLPRLGSKGFGSVTVEYAMPQYIAPAKRRAKRG